MGISTDFFLIHEFSVFQIVDIINKVHIYQISPYQKQYVHYRRVNTILTQLFISAVILIPRCIKNLSVKVLTNLHQLSIS